MEGGKCRIAPLIDLIIICDFGVDSIFNMATEPIMKFDWLRLKVKNLLFKKLPSGLKVNMA